MKYLFITLLLLSQAYASLNNINSFEADFVQSITDDKDKTLVYSGHVVASKPQNAKWSYIKPVSKDVYIDSYKVTIVEPEIEQVIIKTIESNFDFFNMIANAKEIKKNNYKANYKGSEFNITLKNNFIESISYIDEFENSVKIIFKNQNQNHKIRVDTFTPIFPLYYDVVRD